MLLLGVDYGDYDTLAVKTVGERTAAGISIGSDQWSPSLRFKGDLDVRNEDALVAVDLESRESGAPGRLRCKTVGCHM